MIEIWRERTREMERRERERNRIGEGELVCNEVLTVLWPIPQRPSLGVEGVNARKCKIKCPTLVLR